MYRFFGTCRYRCVPHEGAHRVRDRRGARRRPSCPATRRRCGCSRCSKLIASKDQRCLAAGAGRGDRAAEADAAPHAAAARRRRPAASARATAATTAPARGCAGWPRTCCSTTPTTARATRCCVDLVEELGESCNVTALSGSEVVYLDRVETAGAAALLPAAGLARAGALLGERQDHPVADDARRSAAACWPTRRSSGYTAEHGHRRSTGSRASSSASAATATRSTTRSSCPAWSASRCWCPTATRPSNLCIAVQAPVMRLTPERAVELLPALTPGRRGDRRIEAEGSADQS